MKKVLAALAASGVLVAGGFATAAVSTPATAQAQETTDEAPATTDDVVRPERGAILEEVLDELVADGVIDADQATQIAEALEAKHDELREEFGDRRGGRGFRGHGDRFGLMEALEDGVIDAAELAELPEGHPLTDPDGPAAQYLDDGQLTLEELEEMRAEFGSQRGPRGFGGFAPSEEAGASA